MNRSSGHAPRAFFCLGLGGLLSLMVLTLTSASVHGQTPAPNGKTALYLALGDSIAAGIGASDPTRRGYPAVVLDYLKRQLGQPVVARVLAVPNETTASLLSDGQLDAARQELAAAAAAGQTPRLITLTVGANDLLNAGTAATERDRALVVVRTNLDRLLAALRADLDRHGHSNVVVVVTTVYDPTGSDPRVHGTDGWWIARLNRVIAEVAERERAVVADLAGWIVESEPLMTHAPYDLHPTNAGHVAIAGAVFAASGLDREPPAVHLLRPTAGPLSRLVTTIAADVSDRVGVASVRLLVDGVDVGELPYVPALGQYATLWDSRSVPPGPHRITVRAIDVAANEADESIEISGESFGSP